MANWAQIFKPMSSPLGPAFSNIAEGVKRQRLSDIMRDATIDGNLDIERAIPDIAQVDPEMAMRYRMQMGGKNVWVPVPSQGVMVNRATGERRPLQDRTAPTTEEESLKAQQDSVYQALKMPQTPETYRTLRQQAIQINAPFAQFMPEEYDKEAVEQILYSKLPMKDYYKAMQGGQRADTSSLRAENLAKIQQQKLELQKLKQQKLEDYRERSLDLRDKQMKWRKEKPLYKQQLEQKDRFEEMPWQIKEFYQYDAQGNPLTELTREDVKNTKTGAAVYKKVQTGINKINNLLSDQKSFVGGKISPKTRARLKVITKGMQLTEKERQNLGVLNGPDLDILEQMIADPNQYILFDSWRASMNEFETMLNDDFKSDMAVKGFDVPGISVLMKSKPKKQIESISPQMPVSAPEQEYSESDYTGYDWSVD